jgi:hypothetical protein
MDDTERQELADRLSGMDTLKAARKEIMRLDRRAELKIWRNSIWNEYHSLFVLPNQGVEITLIETMDTGQMNDLVASSHHDQKKLKVGFDYRGARVDPLRHRVKNSTSVP